MDYDDREAADRYSDPAARETTGTARRRKQPALSSHVPVRFSPETIAVVQVLAQSDRKTVSSWIRDVVEAEVARRSPHHETKPSFVPMADSNGSTVDGTKTGPLVGASH